MRGRFRCPQCLTLFFAPGAMCTGGNPVYDPQAQAGAAHPTHDARLVVPDGSPTVGRRRLPHDPTGMPRVVRVHTDAGAPLVYGPFPTAGAAGHFINEHRLDDAVLDIVYPPGDARPQPEEDTA